MLPKGFTTAGSTGQGARNRGLVIPTGARLLAGARAEQFACFAVAGNQRAR
jgi:hypothetical protein